ncbi:MAG: hypothetical protein HYW34_00525 [Candidatus Brennerbacteria bacterium]|nr:hypothetical protein [Candidatus Brennerbacteria bacterium]
MWIFNSDSFIKESEITLTTIVEAVLFMKKQGVVSVHETDISRSYSDSNFSYSTNWNDGIITVQ